MKNFSILLLLYLFLNIQAAYTKEVAVEVTPAVKITTCDETLQEGDLVKFYVINDVAWLKKGDIVTGTVTNLETNGFMGKSAQILIENFTVNGKKLQGNVYVSGNEHKKYQDYVDNVFSSHSWLIRGGEVNMIPNKNVYILYWEQK